MGARSEIQSSLAEAFDNDLADAVEDLTLIQYSDSHDVDTGVVTRTETNVSTRGIPYDIKTYEVFNEAVQPGDIAYIILQNELPVTPEIDNDIENGTTKYKIMSVSQDPTKSVWELLCRS